MKRLVRLASKLYPRAWRARYGEEFEALLDEERGSSLVVLDVFAGALLMQARRGRNVALIALSAFAVIFAASQWASQHLYITPGTHQTFHMDSAPGAMLEFLVLLILAFAGMSALMKVPRASWIFAAVAASYMGAILLVSVLTGSDPPSLRAHSENDC